MCSSRFTTLSRITHNDLHLPCQVCTSMPGDATMHVESLRLPQILFGFVCIRPNATLKSDHNGGRSIVYKTFPQPDSASMRRR